MLFSVAFHGLRLLKRILSLAVFTLEQLACIASVSVGFPRKFRCFGRAKIKVRRKKEIGGRERGEKETLADKPLEFENRPLLLSRLSVLTEV